jgi:hypothetical protein
VSIDCGRKGCGGSFRPLGPRLAPTRVRGASFRRAWSRYNVHTAVCWLGGLGEPGTVGCSRMARERARKLVRRRRTAEAQTADDRVGFARGLGRGGGPNGIAPSRSRLALRAGRAGRRGRRFCWTMKIRADTLCMTAAAGRGLPPRAQILIIRRRLIDELASA